MYSYIIQNGRKCYEATASLMSTATMRMTFVFDPADSE